MIKPASLLKQGLFHFFSPLQIICFGSHGGFCFIQQSYDYPLIRLIGHIKKLGDLLPRLKGPKRVCCTAQLKHRYPASRAHK